MITYGGGTYVVGEVGQQSKIVYSQYRDSLLRSDLHSQHNTTYKVVRKYGKTVDIQIIYGQFIVMSKDCRESNVQRASFMLKVESGDSAKLSLSSGTKYS